MNSPKFTGDYRAPSFADVPVQAESALYCVMM